MSRAGGRRDPAALVLLAALLFLPGLGARDLWNPSEPAYGRAVVEMSDSGEWLIPTVNGERFLEKPILYFWLARVAGLAGGVNEWTLRLPALLSAIVAVVFVYLLGRREAGVFVGRASALLFLTFVSVAAAARQIQMDLPATACTAALVWFGLPAIRKPRDFGMWAGFGLASGIGFLFRGPVIWIYAAFPLAAACWLDTERRLPSLRAVATAALVNAALVAAWVVPLAAGGELGALRESILRQAVSRFVDPWDHVRPWWYYLKYVWLDLAPWSLLLPLALGGAEDDPRRRTARRVAAAWLIGTIVFFSFSASKRSAYLMPAAPAAALLLGLLVERAWHERLGRFARAWIRGARALLALALLAGAWFVAGLRRDYPEEVGILGLTTGALALAGLVCAVSLPFAGRRALVAVWLTVASLQAYTGAWLLPQANRHKSARAFANEVSRVAAGDPVSGYRLWLWRADYAYYLGRPTGRVRSPEALAEIWESPRRHCVIVEQWKRDEALAAIGERPPDARGTVGSKEVELYCNRQPEFSRSRSRCTRATTVPA